MGFTEELNPSRVPFEQKKDARELCACEAPYAIRGSEFEALATRVNELRTAHRNLEYDVRQAWVPGHAPAAGDGTTDDSPALKALVDAIPASGGDVVLRSGTYRLASSLTTPKHIRWRMEPGASVQLDAGVVLTINGAFAAGLYQVFSGDGTVAFGKGSLREVLPQWWGAKGDGMAHDLTALQAAIAAAATVGAEVYLPPGNYYVPSPLVVTTDRVALVGSSSGASAITSIVGSTAGNYFTVRFVHPSSNTYLHNVRLSNLTIRGGLELDGVVDFRASGVAVSGSLADNILVRAGYIHTWRDCASYFAAAYGFRITEATGTLVNSHQGLQMSGMRIEHCAAGGLRSDGSVILIGCEISGGIIESNAESPAPAGWGMDIQRARGLFVSRTYFEANTAGNIRLGSMEDPTYKVLGVNLDQVLNYGASTPYPRVGIHVVRGDGVKGWAHHGYLGTDAVLVEDGCSDCDIRGPVYAGDVNNPAVSMGVGVSVRGAGGNGILHGLCIIRNGGFESWAGETVPSGWTRVHGDETVVESATEKNSGTKGASITSTAGTNGGILQVFTPFLAHLKNRRVTVGAMVKANAANSVAVVFTDGAGGEAYSTYHPGDGQWHMLFATLLLSDKATAPALRILGKAPSGAPLTFYADDAFCHVGVMDPGSRLPHYLGGLALLSGTVTTAGTGTGPYTATITHNLYLQASGYRVLLTPWVAGMDVRVTKALNSATVTSAVPGQVDYLIIHD